MPKRLLVIDDDALLRRSLAYNLEQNGFHTLTASNAEDGLTQASLDPPDLVLLDIGLPGMDGLQAIKEFRARLGLPVILLTARRRELDEVLGLELGADDYVTKPYNLDVLLAHIRAVLRRSSLSDPVSNGPLEVGILEIDPQAHSASLAGKPLELTPREFDLLFTLAQNAGKTISSEDLLKYVWGAEFVGEPQVVYVHMRSLRLKLDQAQPGSELISTLRGVGYRLELK